MSIKHSQEKREFQDSLRSFLSEKITSTYLRSRITAKASDPELWHAINELGLNEYFSDLEGTNLGVHDLALVALESGRALLPEELSCRILTGPVLEKMLALSKPAISPTIIETVKKAGYGSITVAAEGELKVASTASGVTLSGHLPVAISACESELLIVLCENTRRGFVLSAKGGPQIERTDSLDETLRLSQVSLANTVASEMPQDIASKLLGMLYTIRACELAGVVAKAVEMTSSYVKTRKQYGVPIGGFQAVQHKLADMQLQAEAMRALSNFAAWSADNSPEQFSLASLSALLYAVEQAPLCLEAAVQLHGGIGFTYEFDLHLYLRRAKALSMIFYPSQAMHQQVLQYAAA